LCRAVSRYLWSQLWSSPCRVARLARFLCGRDFHEEEWVGSPSTKRSRAHIL
jgi:hypothetical protein